MSKNFYEKTAVLQSSGVKGAGVSVDGWYSDARRVLSPNCDSRTNNKTRSNVQSSEISLLVIHNISLPPGEFGGPYIERLFTNCLSPDDHPYFANIADTEVSAHLLINRNGECTQFVSFDQRAWHAGQSCFEGHEHCNDFSIGIELEGTDTSGYTEIQYALLAEITRALQTRYPSITRERIVGHSDIAPGRKTDPGPGFDWHKFLALLEKPD